MCDVRRPGAHEPQRHKSGIPYAVFFMFATVTSLGVIGDVRKMRAGALKGAPRVIRHLWRMCYAFWITTASFFWGPRERVAKILPDVLVTPAVLSIPVIAVIVVMLYWLWRVRFKRNLRGSLASTSHIGKAHNERKTHSGSPADLPRLHRAASRSLAFPGGGSGQGSLLSRRLRRAMRPITCRVHPLTCSPPSVPRVGMRFTHHTDEDPISRSRQVCRLAKAAAGRCPCRWSPRLATATERFPDTATAHVARSVPSKSRLQTLTAATLSRSHHTLSWLLLRGRMIPVAHSHGLRLASILLVATLPLQLAILSGRFFAIRYHGAVRSRSRLWLIIKGSALPAKR